MKSLFDRFGLRQRFVVDAVFAAVMAILFLTMYSNLQTVQDEVIILFVSSYACLGLGALVFYLVAGMNFRAASLAHVGTFPFLNIFVLFSKWLPIAITKVQGEEEALSIGLLAYVLISMIYLVSQLLLHLNEPERVRQFRGVTL